MVLWDAAARNRLADEPFASGCTSMAFSPDGKTLAVGYGIYSVTGVGVAGGSVVTKDVPANTLWGGSPAKLIRDLQPAVTSSSVWLAGLCA